MYETKKKEKKNKKYKVGCKTQKYYVLTDTEKQHLFSQVKMHEYLQSV